MTKPTNDEVVLEATKLARENGMYIVQRYEAKARQGPVLMYLVFRRLRYANHGTLLGKRNSPTGLLKLVTKLKDVK